VSVNLVNVLSTRLDEVRSELGKNEHLVRERALITQLLSLHKAPEPVTKAKVGKTTQVKRGATTKKAMAALQKIAGQNAGKTMKTKEVLKAAAAYYKGNINTLTSVFYGRYETLGFKKTKAGYYRVSKTA
jgi:hypothetical protein